MNELILRESKLNNMKGLSPLVSMVLVIAFGFAAMTIVLTIVNPMLDRAKDSGIVNEATQNMQLVDSAIKAVASEARGSKRTVHIKITEGVLRSDIGKEWLYLDYDPKARTVLDGFSGDVRIESKPIFLEYFNQYNDNANANDTWTSVNGTWSVSSNRLLGVGGIAYHSLNNRQDFEFTASVIPSTSPYGQVYLVPGEPRDLILYLTFDGNINDTHRTAFDYSAYKNNGTLLNATSATCFTNNACPAWVSGRFGNATGYDGIGDLTNITGVNQFNSTSFSVAFWTNPNSTRVQGIIAKTTVPTNQRWRVFMYNTGGGIEFDATGDIGNVQSTTNLAAGTWYFITATYDGTRARIYVNGEFEASATASTMFNNNTNHIEISPSETNRFNGTVDEVMMWNKNLTDNEVAFLYQSSERKVTTQSEIQPIGEDANVTIVLASPESTYFDNIKVKGGEPVIRFIIPYNRVDIEQQIRFGPGDHNIVIRHNGTNSTNNNRPLIRIQE